MLDLRLIDNLIARIIIASYIVLKYDVIIIITMITFKK